jgi:hypothetical protein
MREVLLLDLLEPLLRVVGGVRWAAQQDERIPLELH